VRRSQGLIAGRLSSGGLETNGAREPGVRLREAVARLSFCGPRSARPPLPLDQHRRRRLRGPCSSMRLSFLKKNHHVVNFLIVSSRHNCHAGVQRKGWSTLRGLLWRTVRAVKPHPCATKGGDRAYPGVVSCAKSRPRRATALLTLRRLLCTSGSAKLRAGLAPTGRLRLTLIKVGSRGQRARGHLPRLNATADKIPT